MPPRWPCTARSTGSPGGRSRRRARLWVEGAGTHCRTLGVGATVSVSRHGRPSIGHRFYRLTATGRAEIADVTFTLSGSGRYRNPERIVHLYNYLLDGARRARSRATAPRLTAAHATLSDGLVELPLRLAATDRAGARRRACGTGRRRRCDDHRSGASGHLLLPARSPGIDVGDGHHDRARQRGRPGRAGARRRRPRRNHQPVHPTPALAVPAEVGGRLRYRLVLGEKLTSIGYLG